MSVHPMIPRASCAAFALAVALAFPAPALAQYVWSDDEVTGGDGPTAADPDYGLGDVTDEDFGDARQPRRRPQGAPVRQRPRIDPYIEVSQIGVAQLEPGNELATYTQAAVGVDASVQGRNAGGSVSLRYDRVLSGDDLIADSDNISGVARGYTSIVPGALTFEAGGLAARTTVDGGGGTTLGTGFAPRPENESQIYSIYAGPNLSTQVGAVNVDANYRFGYNRIEAPGVGVVDDTFTPIGVAEESIVHSASARAGVRPGAVLPVGIGIGGGAYQEEITNGDQRIRDLFARADVTVPLAPGFAVVGGVGYEYVEVSSRDVVRDGAGVPVLDADGRFVTDDASPRQIAFETEGLIWDVGVVWRPSRRTQLQATYGRRYDSDTYYGSFSYQPNSRNSLAINVYDTISGFGGTITNGLANLPTGFTASRNALTGDFTGCVAGSQEAGGCLGGAIASVRGAVFRNRGIGLGYSNTSRRIATSFGFGYDRRTFIAAPGTAFAAADGVADEAYFANVTMSTPVGLQGAFSINGYASYLDPGATELGNALLLGASAAYTQNIFRNLSARAAIAIDTIERENLIDETNASALLGLRYDF